MIFIFLLGCLNAMSVAERGQIYASCRDQMRSSEVITGTDGEDIELIRQIYARFSARSLTGRQHELLKALTFVNPKSTLPNHYDGSPIIDLTRGIFYGMY